MIPSIVETCRLTRLQCAAHPFDADSSSPHWRRRRGRHDTFPDDGTFPDRNIARCVHDRVEGVSDAERLRGRHLVTIFRGGMKRGGMKLMPARAGTSLSAYGYEGDGRLKRVALLLNGISRLL
jgi:hypothetical protein